MENEEIDKQSEREAWLNSPYGMKIRKQLERQREEAVQWLMSVASRSTDPEVRFAISRVTATEHALSLLLTGEVS